MSTWHEVRSNHISFICFDVLSNHRFTIEMSDSSESSIGKLRDVREGRVDIMGHPFSFAGVEDVLALLDLDVFRKDVFVPEVRYLELAISSYLGVASD